MKSLEKFVQYLKQFSYPNIQQLKSPDEYSKLFVGEQRVFLVHWLLKEFDLFVPMVACDAQGKYQIFIKELSDLIAAQGFCNDNESLGFVQGNLKDTAQEVIFERIFNTLSKIKKADDDDAEIANHGENIEDQASHYIRNPADGLKEFLNRDLNLFAALGPIITCTAEKRAEDIKLYKQLIKDTKDSIVTESEIVCNADDDIPINLINNLTDDLNKSIAKVKERAPGVLNNALPIVNNCSSDNEIINTPRELVAVVEDTDTLLNNYSNFVASSALLQKYLEEKKISPPKQTAKNYSGVYENIKHCATVLNDVQNSTNFD